MASVQEREAVARLVALVCRNCGGENQPSDIGLAMDQGWTPCSVCLNHWGKPSGRLFPKLLEAHTPSDAIHYLTNQDEFIFLKHAPSGFYQVQWGASYGTGDTPLLAIDNAIMQEARKK